MTTKRLHIFWFLCWLIATGENAFAIIGGQAVEYSDGATASAVVALQMSELQEDGTTRYYKGSAFLIGPDLLLTAAHNVVYIPNPEHIEAIFSSAPCWGPNSCGEKRIAASQTFAHPLFRQISGGTEFDLAVIKLADSAPVTHVPIRLIETAPEEGLEKVSILGFGTDRQEQNIPLAAFRLRTILDRAIVANYRLGTNQKFWVDQKDGGFCGGDSGGPAVVEGEKVVGIAIHVTYDRGVGNCLTRGALTDVLYFRDWVASAVGLLRAPAGQVGENS